MKNIIDFFKALFEKVKAFFKKAIEVLSSETAKKVYVGIACLLWVIFLFFGCGSLFDGGECFLGLLGIAVCGAAVPFLVGLVKKYFIIK